MYRISAIQSLDIPNRSDQCQTFLKIWTAIGLCRSDIRFYGGENNLHGIIRNAFDNWANENYFFKYSRPSAWDFATKTWVLRFVADNPISSDAPYISDIVSRATVGLLCFWINVIAIWIRAHELADAQLTTIYISGHDLIQLIRQN